MGIWDTIHSTVGSPELTPVKNACQTTYTYGLSAATTAGTAVKGEAARAAGLLSSASGKIRASVPDLTPVSKAIGRADRLVRVEATQKVKQTVADREFWDWVARTAINVTHYAAAEVSRPYTWGIPVYKIAKEALKNGPPRPLPERGEEAEIRELRARLDRMEAMLEKRGAAVDGSATTPLLRNCRRPWWVATGPQNPEEVLSLFMMKGFNGAKFVDDQVWDHPLAANTKEDA